jgi:hypothetical protein
MFDVLGERRGNKGSFNVLMKYGVSEILKEQRILKLVRR